MDGARFVLVEKLDRVMPEVNAGLADFATRELRARGIEVRTGTSLDSVDEVSATLSTGERVPAPHPVLDRRSQAAQGGRGARPRGR